MRLFALIVLVAGLLLSGGAVWYMYGQFKDAEARLRDVQPEVIKIPTVSVAVARKRLTYGQTIDEDSVRMIEWPEDSVPEGAFTELSQIVEAGRDLRYVLRRMEKHEPILPQKISGFGERATVAALLEPGMLAYTLSVSLSNSVGGFILPGTRIDIILTVNARNEGLKTYFLLQNVEVIAVDQDTDADRISARVARSLTLSVTPEELKALTLASNLGKITVALRGFGAEGLHDPGALNRQQLLGERQREKAAPAPSVRVRKGNEVRTQTLE